MRVLFQGDSITDAGRNKENEKSTGAGYPTLVAARLGFDYPNEYEFFNRGVSGNRISNLIVRMKADMINLKPDVISILIGVNDVWHEFTKQNGVNAVLYEKLYHILIDELKTELPNLRIISPFC